MERIFKPLALLFVVFFLNGVCAAEGGGVVQPADGGVPERLIVVSLPEEPNVVKDLGQKVKQGSKFLLGAIAREALRSIQIQEAEELNDGPRLEALSPEEAARHFSPADFGEHVSPDLWSTIKERMFTPTFFGRRSVPIERFGEGAFCSDSRASDDVLHAIRSKSAVPLRRTESWTHSVKSMSPEEAFKAFVKALPACAQEHGIRSPILSEHRDLEHVTQIFNAETFGIPEEPHARREYLLNNTIGFLTPQLTEQIFEAAQTIMSQTKQGDYILIFGNTPVLVGRALKLLCSRDRQSPFYREVIDFPFSGSPNRMILPTRNTAGRDFSGAKNYVTEERLRHLLVRGHACGVSPVNGDLQIHTLYIVDVIASGSGPAYFIEEFLKSCRSSHVQFPDIKIICLNEIDIENEYDSRNSSIARHSASHLEKVALHFPSLQDTHIIVPAQVIYIPGHQAMDMLPSNEWRVFPEYHAAFWSAEYDYLLDEQPSPAAQLLLEAFDAQIWELYKNMRSEVVSFKDLSDPSGEDFEPGLNGAAKFSTYSESRKQTNGIQETRFF